MNKSNEAFRTISEVAAELEIQKHVLRFWEVKFPQIKPMKRGGGRRYYRPEDVVLLRGIRALLHAEGYTIKGVQKILREQGVDGVKAYATVPVKKSRAAATSGDTSGPRDGARRASAPAETGRVRGMRQPAKKPAATTRAPDDAAIIASAIRELQACRAMLIAATPKPSETRTPVEPIARRASRSR